MMENYLPSPNTAIVISTNDNVNHADLENDTQLYRESDSDRSYWNRSNILWLINLYKEHSNLFKTMIIRNEKVWEKKWERIPMNNVKINSGI
ncbi:hypothetical protein NQ314_001737 [Rhamnusium bicolor]|uniref:Uncharacterized protein n=1 Tax=Rhamnusium bicolor TaxID=1586634 RepID=A0AAV8ZTD2_9CUCU|nr:hypothetical protein NQ314_001737 [Rhamnusium bicolor]